MGQHQNQVQKQGKMPRKLKKRLKKLAEARRKAEAGG